MEWRQQMEGEDLLPPWLLADRDDMLPVRYLIYFIPS